MFLFQKGCLFCLNKTSCKGVAIRNMDKQYIFLITVNNKNVMTVTSF